MKTFFTVLVMATAAYASGFPLKKYGTFLADQAKPVCKEGNFSYDMSTPPASSDMTFTGGIREITGARKEFIKGFATAINRPADKDFVSEIEVQEGPTKYWLPIQTQTLNSFSPVAKTGGKVLVSVRFAGCYKENDAQVPMALMMRMESF